MTEMAGTETTQADGPVLLWEGQAAMFARPDGGRGLRYEIQEEPRAEPAERFISLPPELTGPLEMLAANPGALDAIAQGPMGGLAKRMARHFASKAAAAHAAGQ